MAGNSGKMTNEALAAREFTASPHGKSVAVVVGGEVACRHKLRAQVLGPEVQVSCCNPLYCDQWNALLPKTIPSSRAVTR